MKGEIGISKEVTETIMPCPIKIPLGGIDKYHHTNGMNLHTNGKLEKKNQYHSPHDYREKV